jgi:hypothetical protein
MLTKVESKQVIIKAPNWERATIHIVGTAPYVQNRFSKYKQNEMAKTQEEGSKAKKTRKGKPPKDFNKIYEESLHISQDGWHGIPATAFRNAMIDACRLTEFDMVRCKMCVKIVPDGLDAENLEPLVKITKGKPRMFVDRVRVGISSTDLAARGMFEKWEADVTIEWDADVFQAVDVVNLLARAGLQVGVGAGRPLSKTSGGTGKGTWEVHP